MTLISLEQLDFQEILSSLLLGAMSYPQRLRLAADGSLAGSLRIDRDMAGHSESLLQRACSMFDLAESRFDPAAITLAERAAEMHRLWNEAPSHITFFTSGSTGEPVPATQDMRFHMQEVAAWAELFKDRQRIVSFVPRHHIYGFLFSILLPKAMACPVQWMPIMPLRSLVDCLQSGDLVIAFPLFWEKMAELGVGFPGRVRGVTSTGPCRAEILHALGAQGLEDMTEVYGSSETGGVGYRRNPEALYELLPYWERGPMDDRLYRRHPLDGSPVPYALQDDLNWQGEQYFLPAGRVDKAVQVAGVNVYPNRVRNLILEHPAVAACAVRLMRPDEGSRLKALIVLKTREAEQLVDRELRALLVDKLDHYERPARLTYSDRLPRNPLGKLQDW